MTSNVQEPPLRRRKTKAEQIHDDRPSNESAVLRYDRIATIETIMNIRSKQTASRRTALLLTAVAALLMGLATAFGWI